MPSKDSVPKIKALLLDLERLERHLEEACAAAELLQTVQKTYHDYSRFYARCRNAAVKFGVGQLFQLPTLRHEVKGAQPRAQLKKTFQHNYAKGKDLVEFLTADMKASFEEVASICETPPEQPDEQQEQPKKKKARK